MQCGYEVCLYEVNCVFDVIFVDPPYKSGYYYNVLSIIDKRNLLSENGVVVCEHLAEDDLPDNIGVLEKYDSRKMGTVKFDFYRRSN